MFLTKTNWELSNSMHSFERVLVLYIVLPLIAVATPTLARKYSVLSCIITKSIPITAGSFNTEIR